MRKTASSLSRVKVQRIGEVLVGGAVGELPTVLIGTIFYREHKIVKDHVRGVFDRAIAEKLIVQQDELSDTTGVPCMVDVVGETPEALQKYTEFVSSVTDSPILLNGPTADVRLKAFEYIVDIGIQDRTIYTSISYTVKEDEVLRLKELGVRNILIQAFNPRNPWPRGSLEMVVGDSSRKGLLQYARDAGATNILILAPVLDVPYIGVAATTLEVLREKTGLPVGLAPCGVVAKWCADTNQRGFREILTAGVLGYVQAMGANFIIYGSIRKAPKVFPVCALIDSMIAYSRRREGIRPLVKSHPIYKFLVRAR